MVGTIGISGYEDGTFKPNSEITRAEMVALTKRYLNYSWEKAVEFVMANAKNTI